MTIFTCILLFILVICAIAASFSKNLLNTILVFMSYSLVMSIIWVILESPDLAITEAAVGAGVTTVLFVITLKKIHAIIKTDEEAQKKAQGQGAENPEGNSPEPNAETAEGSSPEQEAEVSEGSSPGQGAENPEGNSPESNAETAESAEEAELTEAPKEKEGEQV